MAIRKSNVLAVVLIGILLITLGGCGKGNNLDSSNDDEMELYIKEVLHEKYGGTFEIVEGSNESMQSTYVVEAYNMENEEEIFDVKVTSTGELKDKYTKYYYKEEANKEVRELCKSSKYITGCMGSIIVPSNVYDEELYTYEEYREIHGLYMDVEMNIDGKNPYYESSEYAKEVFKLQEEILSASGGAELSLSYEGGGIIYNWVYDEDNEDFIVLDEEEIEEEIHSSTEYDFSGRYSCEDGEEYEWTCPIVQSGEL